MFAFLQLLCFHSQNFGTYKIVCDFASKTNVAKLEVPTRHHFKENLYIFGCEWKKSAGNFGIDFQGLDVTHNILNYHPDFDSNTPANDPDFNSNTPWKLRRIQADEDDEEGS
jgi:hypothetical protein